MQSCVAENSSLRMLGLHDFGMHYARTLRLWNERFHERVDEVRVRASAIVLFGCGVTTFAIVRPRFWRER